MRWIRRVFIVAGFCGGGWIAFTSPRQPSWHRLAYPLLTGGVAWSVSRPWEDG